MPPLPVVSSADAVRKLERLGWLFVRQAGSHMILVKTDSVVSISVPKMHKTLFSRKWLIVLRLFRTSLENVSASGLLE